MLVVVQELSTAVPLLVAERRIYGVWASVVVIPGLESTGSIVVVHGLSCSGALWGLPGLGIKPVSPSISRQILYP